MQHCQLWDLGLGTETKTTQSSALSWSGMWTVGCPVCPPSWCSSRIILTSVVVKCPAGPHRPDGIGNICRTWLAAGPTVVSRWWVWRLVVRCTDTDRSYQRRAANAVVVPVCCWWADWRTDRCESVPGPQFHSYTHTHTHTHTHTITQTDACCYFSVVVCLPDMSTTWHQLTVTQETQLSPSNRATHLCNMWWRCWPLKHAHPQ